MGRKVRVYKENEKEFLKDFDKLCVTRSTWQVWQDFVTLSACSISNTIETREEVRKIREKEYLSVSKRYNPEELNVMCRLLADTVEAFEKEPGQDYLGELYMNLNLGQNQKGQFFTPWNISLCMAKMISGNLSNEIERQGFFNVNDPTCGAGCLLIAYAYTARFDQKINYQERGIFVGIDIDPLAAKMCYIQLSLLGCPGYVFVGNSLFESFGSNILLPEVKNEEDIWYTPMYYRLLGAVIGDNSEENTENQNQDDIA